MNKGEIILQKLLSTEYHFLRYQDRYILFTMDGKATLMNESAFQLIQLISENRNVDGIPISFLEQIEMALSSDTKTSSSTILKLFLLAELHRKTNTKNMTPKMNQT